MTAFQLQVTLFPTSNIPADASTNTWSCEADDLTAAIAFKDAVLDFYDLVLQYLSGDVRQDDHVWKLYDRTDPEPRYPAAEGLFDLVAAPAGNPLPPECAVCVSFEGLPTSGIPQARRRGRIYLGPMDTTTLASNGRPSPTAINGIVSAADDLLTASLTATTWLWCVWSTVDGGNTPIARGWVDDEFDTQRRRGRVATTRTVYP